MKNTLCLFLSLLFLLPTFTGCNDGSFSSLPENSPSFSPSIGQDGGESRPSSPSFAPIPSEGGEADPSFSELPLPIDEIYFYVQRIGVDAVNQRFDPKGYFESSGICPEEISEGTATVAFCIGLNPHFPEVYGQNVFDAELADLDALFTKSFSDLLSWEKSYYGHLYNEEGKPIPEEFELEKESARYAFAFAERFFEIGEDAMKQEVKELWLERCKKANIPAVDVGKDYLYVICTYPQLIAMADRSERGHVLFSIHSASKEQYIADRKNMVK